MNRLMLYMLTASKKAFVDGGVTEDEMDELDKSRCRVMIGSAMGGMKSPLTISSIDAVMPPPTDYGDGWNYHSSAFPAPMATILLLGLTSQFLQILGDIGSNNWIGFVSTVSKKFASEEQQMVMSGIVNTNLQKELNRYIPIVVAFGSETGMLLAVTIIYQYFLLRKIKPAN